MSREILIIVRDENISQIAAKNLESIGCTVVSHNRLSSGLKAVKDCNQVVILDLDLPDVNGLDGLQDIISSNPDVAVILLTSTDNREHAVEAMKEGAYCYIEKPINIEEMKIVVEKAFSSTVIRREIKRLKDSEAETPKIIGKSERMLKALKDIGRASVKDSAVLITGENGTGKRLVARAIHYSSRRLSGPFITLDCASVSKDNIEAEFFGHGKAASKELCTSIIESAQGGILFLNEISELDSDMQAKLYKVMQEKEFSPAGSTKVLKADMRIIAGTSKNLKDAVSNSLFREDLYNKFNTIHIKLPLLKDRREDILQLAKHFIRDAHKKFGTGQKDLSKDAKDFILSYDWPGNVRELENTIRKACIISDGLNIEKNDLKVQDENPYSIKEFLDDKLKKYLRDITTLGKGNLYADIISETEKSLISIVLKETKGNQLKTAKILGINRNTLRAKIRDYKI